MRLMDELAVAPGYLERPLRLRAFQGLTLAPRRIAGPGLAKALSRPYRVKPLGRGGWPRGGSTVLDSEPAIYLHEYTAQGLTVRALVGAVDLTHRAATQAESAVLPHERVHEDQARRLGERMARLELQPAPILLVHRGPAAVRELVRARLEQPPDSAFTDRGRQRHRIWAFRDEAAQRLSDLLGGSTPMIADGHHRYAAYLELQQRHPGTGWDLGLAAIVDQDDTPLFLGAIHRVLRGVGLSGLGETARAQGWTVRELARADALQALGPGRVVATDHQRWLVLAADSGTEPLVQVVHTRLLERLDPAGTAMSMSYHHGVEDALRAVQRSPGVAVLLPAPDFDAITRLVRGQRLLPEKATSFQPKPSVGVLMRPVRAAAPCPS